MWSLMLVSTCVSALYRALILLLVGLEEPALYQNSPAYLAPGGAYVTVGTSGNSILPLIRTLFAVVLPKWLGGTPRPYK